MFVGYSDHHAADTYRLYMLGTGRVVIARDVLWMNVFFNNETRIDINSEGIDMEGWIDEDSDQDYNLKEKKKVTFNITENKQKKTYKDSTINRSTSQVNGVKVKFFKVCFV